MRSHPSPCAPLRQELQSLQCQVPVAPITTQETVEKKHRERKTSYRSVSSIHPRASYSQRESTGTLKHDTAIACLAITDLDRKGSRFSVGDLVDLFQEYIDPKDFVAFPPKLKGWLANSCTVQ